MLDNFDLAPIAGAELDYAYWDAFSREEKYMLRGFCGECDGQFTCTRDVGHRGWCMARGGELISVFSKSFSWRRTIRDNGEIVFI